MDDNKKLSEYYYDSLDIIQVIMDIEHQFDITIDDEEITNLKTINDLIKMVKEKTGR